MVNIFSFFTGGRKKSKRSSWAGVGTSPDNNIAVTTSPAQEVVKRQTSKFLSLRTRSSARIQDAPKDSSDPRRSAESLRRRGSRMSKSFGALPKLDLDLGPSIRVDPGYDDGQAGQGLGLDDYGQIPNLTNEEVEVIRAVQLNVDEIKSCWEVFGGALKQTGCDTVGLMLPQHHDPDPKTVHHLLALFLLHHQPALAPSFPSIQSRTSHHRPMPLYSDLLGSALKERPHPHELCQILIFALQHLTPSQSPSIDTSMYTKFVQAEHAASYPLDAYTSILLPRLPQGVGMYLDTVFDVLGEIASKSEDNMVTGGKLCLVLGRWIWGAKTSEGLAWEEIYHDWQVTGRRVEHLFYAWIRSQSVKVTMPTRLLELIEAYPFGESTLSTEHLPSPPPSTFHRHTLHIKLESDTSLPIDVTPATILLSALSSENVSSSPLLASIREQATIQGAIDPDHLLAYDSQAFLKRFSPPTLATEDSRPTTMRPFGTSRSQSSQSRFSILQESNSHANLRSDPFHRSASNSTSPALTPLAELSEQVASLANGHRASSTQQSAQAPSNWDDFSQSGFGDTLIASQQLDLTSTAKDIPLPLSPLPKEVSLPLASPVYELSAVDERVIEIDDAFLSFVEDTQLAGLESGLSTVCLIRLSSAVSAALDTPTPVDWLLLTVSTRVPIVEHPTSLVVRGPSPGRESVMSHRRFSLGGLASTFRRSTSGSVRATQAATPRKSIFGGTSKNLPAQYEMESVSEQPPPELVKSKDPEEIVSVGEMGELRPQPVVVAPNHAADTVSMTMQKSGPSGTPTSYWHYVAEGGANIVFGYHGPDSQFEGRALRIPKNYEESNLATTWRDDLLPRLLMTKDLPTRSAIKLSGEWVKDLMKVSAENRPQVRRDADQSALWSEVVVGSLMDDLRSEPKKQGQKVLAIEIKPKWGFTPSAEFVVPPEAAAIKSQYSRYRLHQHLRGKASEYEPLDLYSGDQNRVKKALSSLWGLWSDSRGHTNSWRIFVDGQLFEIDQVSSIPGSDPDLSIVDRSMPIILPALERSAVLQRLRDLQSHLDATDISYIAQRFTLEHPDVPLFDPSLIPEPTSEELHQFIDLYVLDPESAKSWTLRQSIIAYSLSAIFKDCSIFITCPLVQRGNGWEAIEAETTVKVIDLDLKPIKNMRKWYDLDEEIWRHWHDTHQLSSAAHDTPERTALAQGDENESDNYSTPKPLRAIPERLHNASTDALYVPTPDRPISNPLESPSAQLLSPEMESSSTRGMYTKTPGGSGAGTPVDESSPATLMSNSPADGTGPTPMGRLLNFDLDPRSLASLRSEPSSTETPIRASSTPAIDVVDQTPIVQETPVVEEESFATAPAPRQNLALETVNEEIEVSTPDPTSRPIPELEELGESEPQPVISETLYDTWRNDMPAIQEETLSTSPVVTQALALEPEDESELHTPKPATRSIPEVENLGRADPGPTTLYDVWRTNVDGIDSEDLNRLGGQDSGDQKSTTGDVAEVPAKQQKEVSSSVESTSQPVQSETETATATNHHMSPTGDFTSNTNLIINPASDIQTASSFDRLAAPSPDTALARSRSPYSPLPESDAESFVTSDPPQSMPTSAGPTPPFTTPMPFPETSSENENPLESVVVDTKTRGDDR